MSSQRIQHLREEFEYTQDFVADYLECNRSTYYKNEDREVWSYYFQCYDQKNHGSLNYRMKKGLNTTDACSTPIIAEWKLKLTANVIFDIIWNNKTKIIKIANDIIDQTIQKKFY